MRDISISELSELFHTGSVQEFTFATFNQEVNLNFDPASFYLKFDKLTVFEDAGRIFLENSATQCSMSISRITRISISDDFPKIGLTICIHCCNSENNTRIKNFWILAK